MHIAIHLINTADGQQRTPTFEITSPMQYIGIALLYPIILIAGALRAWAPNESVTAIR